MRRSAALASSLIAGCAGLAGGAAEGAFGIVPATTPASSPPRTAMYRSFTSLSPSPNPPEPTEYDLPRRRRLCTFGKTRARGDLEILHIDKFVVRRKQGPRRLHSLGSHFRGKGK